MAYKKSEEKAEKISQNLNDEIFQYVDDKVESSTADTSTWAENQVKWHKLRMRIKKAKTFPFIGCSNVRMPTAETKIRKLKAALVNVVFGIRPVVQVIPPPSGNINTAMKIEKWLDHLIMDVLNIQPKAVMAIDQELEKGFFILKPYWRTEITTRQETYSLSDLSLEEVMQLYHLDTSPEDIKKALMVRLEVDTSDLVFTDNEEAIEKAVLEILDGKDTIKVELQDVIYNAPDVALCEPEKIYVNTDCGVDPQGAQFICHEFFLPLHCVKYNVKHKGWNAAILNELDEFQKKDINDTRSTLESEKDTYEGITRLKNPNSSVRVWEFYCWYDINDDGIEEKCVITALPDFSRIVKKQTLPFSNGKFPFVKLYYELTSDRWFAHRGIPEIIEDIIKEIDVQHMQKIDQQTIRNTPMFVYRAGMVNPNLVQMIPNQAIPVNGLNPLRDTIDVLNNNNPNVEYSYEREQMLLESKVEELIGQVDFTLQSMINRRQPRTLGEVQLQNQNMQQVFSLDASMHTSQFTELFNFIYDLWSQYGDEQVEFAYFGQNGWENIRLTREEIQGKYKIVVRGNDQNTNPQVKLQKAQQILMAVTNPLFLQTGVITPLHIANGLKYFYQALDIQNWQELINAQPQPIQPPQPTPAQIIKPDFKSLTDAEQAQILASAGVRPDPQGRMLNKQQELIQMASDIGMDESTNIGGE